MTELRHQSYQKILNSTSTIGVAAGINLFLGMIRIKVVVLVVGPVGVGLMATYQALQDIMGELFGLGIQQSAVREIAEASGRGDDAEVARIQSVLRKICHLTGLLGMILMLAMATTLSEYTFESTAYVMDISLLAPAILFFNINRGQVALLQGMRKVRELAQVNALSAIVGTVVAIGLYLALGIRGLAPSLMMLALIQMLLSRYFAGQIELPVVQASWRESFRYSSGLLKLGLVFMWNGLMVALVAYLTRAWIGQSIDLVAVGIFAAAYTLSGVFVNFVLQAMASDYYPRLTQSSHDCVDMCRLVNEQTEISLLLALPGLLATLTFAPWIIEIFYSSEFLAAGELLDWFILGCLGKVISWPLGFVMMAMGKHRLFFASETLINVLHLCLIWFGMALFGLEGVAVAFFSLYLVYVFVVYRVARHLIEFSWSGPVQRLFLISLLLVGLVFLTCRVLYSPFALVVGALLTIVGSVTCLRGMVQRLGSESAVAVYSSKIPGVSWVCRL